MHVARCPKIIAISPFSLQYQGNAKKLGSLGIESGRRIYLGGNRLSHRIVFSWDNAGLLQRRSAWQYVVEATTLVVALTSARVATVDFATTLVRCNHALVQWKISVAIAYIATIFRCCNNSYGVAISL